MDPEDIRLGDEKEISKLFGMQVYEEDAIANVPDGEEILDTVWSRHWKNGGCRSRFCVRDFKLRPTAAPVSGSDTFAATPSHVALRIFILYMLIMNMMARIDDLEVAFMHATNLVPKLVMPPKAKMVSRRPVRVSRGFSQE